MAEAKLTYFRVEEKLPPDDLVRLVLAYERLDRPFWTFAFFKDGVWTENKPDKKDLTDAVECWCDLPHPNSLD